MTCIKLQLKAVL